MQHILGGSLIILFLAYAVASGFAREGKEKAEMVALHNLSANQQTGYDACIYAMRKKKLKKGGSEPRFCGCFVTEAGQHLKAGKQKFVGKVLSEVRDGRNIYHTAEQLEKVIPDSAVQDNASMPRIRMLVAISTCAGRIANRKTGKLDM